MSEGMIYALLGIGGTVLGTIVGWLLMVLTEKWKNKPKLCFAFDGWPEQDELAVKTSPSGVVLRVYNMGTSPIIIENVELVVNKGTVAPCSINGNSALLPYVCTEAELSNEDWDALLYHAKSSVKGMSKQAKIPKCKVFAYCIGAKKAVIDEVDLSCYVF